MVRHIIIVVVHANAICVVVCERHIGVDSVAVEWPHHAIATVVAATEAIRRHDPRALRRLCESKAIKDEPTEPVDARPPEECVR